MGGLEIEQYIPFSLRDLGERVVLGNGFESGQEYALVVFTLQERVGRISKLANKRIVNKKLTAWMVALTTVPCSSFSSIGSCTDVAPRSMALA